MLEMTDYFSKWTEVEDIIQVREKELTSFINHNILTRFGILSKIICDNEPQFIDKTRQKFYVC